MPGGQYVDLAGAELDGMGDRRVVRDATVHQLTVLPPDRREHGGDGGAGDHRIEERAGGEQQLLAGDHVDGDDVQRDRQVLELLGFEVLGDEPTQSGVRHEVGAGAEKAEQAAERVEREDLAALDVVPDRCQVVGGVDGLLPAGDERAVDRPGRGGHDQVGLDAALVEGPQHADLDRAQPGAAGEDERDRRGLPGHGS